jgi:hypothetical protein
MYVYASFYVCMCIILCMYMHHSMYVNASFYVCVYIIVCNTHMYMHHSMYVYIYIILSVLCVQRSLAKFGLQILAPIQSTIDLQWINLMNQFWPQGCQTEYFHIKIPDFEVFWKALEWKTFVHVMASWYMLRSFGIFGILRSFGMMRSFGTFPPGLVWYTKNNLATLFVRRILD